MTNRFKMLRNCLCLLLLLLSVPALADQGEQLFDKLCSRCHTIRQGDGAGPDLAGVAAKRSPDRLVRMIAEPEKLRSGKDPVQQELVEKYGMEMPNLGVDRTDAVKIQEFLKEAEAARAVKAGAAPPIAPIFPNLDLTSTGRALFTGKTRFLSGAPPCMSCHDLRYSGVHGSHFASDLTDILKKIGESGVRGALKSHTFPDMKRVYAQRPLNESETEALMALFQDAAARKHQGWRELFPVGAAGFLVVFMLAVLVIIKRTS